MTLTRKTPAKPRAHNSTLPAPSKGLTRTASLGSSVTTEMRKPRKPIARKSMKKVNVKRRASAFARCYHSRERVRWIKNLECLACAAISPFLGDATRGECDNAHVETDGMGRKADYDKIVPLCRTHHQRYDRHRFPFDNPAAREAMQNMARVVHAAWLASAGASQREERA